MQFFMKLGLFPKNISEQITLLFSYRTVNRMQMVSGEPANMVRNLLFLGILIYFFYHGRYRKISLFALVFFLLVSGSTFGYLTIFLFILVYMLLFKPLLIFNIKTIFIFLCMAFSLYFLMQTFLDDYTLGKINIVLQLLFNANIDTLIKIVSSDGSAFQRIMNPIIGFMSGSSTNYLGTGIDGYRYIYPIYINEHFQFALEFSQVYDAVVGETYITPKSLYAKVYAELGILPFIFFISYLIYLYISIKKLRKKLFLPAMYSLSIVYILNTDSIIYLNYFFMITLIHLTINFIRQNSKFEFTTERKSTIKRRKSP
ncbi:MAG: hypothetical protein GXZ15_05760 [Campylobacter sp.]|nr:hypothetical protein [Campylobacter sp.]